MAHRLASREPDNRRQVNDRLRYWPLAADIIPDGARLGHVSFDEIKIGMVQKRNQRLAAEEQESRTVTR